MPWVRNEILRKLWRGKEPFLSDLARRGMPDLQGWGSQHRYLTEAIETLRPTVVVEVGVWKGASVIHMASRMRELAIDGVVIAVDTWLGAWDHWVDDRWFRELGLLEPAGGIFATFLRNVRDAGLEDYIVPLPLDSINAAQVLSRYDVVPDVVHIDAGHDYTAVRADIEQWWPMIRPGGLMIGDDYRAGNDWPGVKRAFDDHFRPLGLLPLENTDEKCRVCKPAAETHDADLLASLLRIGAAVTRWREDCRLELVSLKEDDGIGVAELLRRYVRFNGPSWPPGRTTVMDLIVAQLKTTDQAITLNDIFGADLEVRTPVVQALVPGFTAHYSRPGQLDEFERFELLPEQENPLVQYALPKPLDINMGKPRAPALAVYRAGPSDLFLTALGYQLFRESDDVYWPAASTRAYPREAMECRRVAVDKCVVIVQDIFEGTNFSHFLFDWVPRLGNFLNSGLEDPSACLFVMGGIPSEFHFHAVQAMCAIYSLREDQFVFPQEPQVWRISRRAYFFSDAKQTVMHPAHMANPHSIAILREVCSRIPTPAGELKRIYISRGDTRLRRIANETELLTQLKAFGFVEVQLGSIPFLEQVKLLRGADVIVAPHGMGLTHIAFHEGRPLIVELHNPTIGTDAYACISHALGFRYRSIMGVDMGVEEHHFTVAPRDVINALLLGERILPVSTGDSDVLTRVRTKFQGGVQLAVASETSDIDPREPGNSVLRHVRDGATVQPDNNIGWLEVSDLTMGTVYHCNIDIWLPSQCNVERVHMASSGLGSVTTRTADLAKRDQWQTVGAGGIVTESHANFVLRCDGEAGSVIYSSAWRAGPGNGAD